MHSTIHKIIQLPFNKNNLLISMCGLQSQTEHAMFSRICKNNKKSQTLITSLSSQEVSEFQKKYKVLGRHINSLNISISGKIASYVEHQKLHLKDLEDELNVIVEKIDSIETQILNIRGSEEFTTFLNQNSEKDLKILDKYLLSQLPKYHQYLRSKDKFLKTNKKYKKSTPYAYNFVFHYDKILFQKFPGYQVLTAHKQALLKQFNVSKETTRLIAVYVKTLANLNRQNIKKAQIEKNIAHIKRDMDNRKIRICFGGKKLFSQKNAIQSFDSFQNKEDYKAYLKDDRIKYKTLDAWKLAWADARSHQFMLSGDAAVTAGNQLCQAIYDAENDCFNFKLRIPTALLSKNNNCEYMEFGGIRFHGDNHEKFKAAIDNTKTVVRKLSDADKVEIKDLIEKKKLAQEDKNELYQQLKKLSGSKKTKHQKVEKAKKLKSVIDNAGEVNLKDDLNSAVITAYTVKNANDKKVKDLTAKIDLKKAEIDNLIDIINTKSDIVNFDVNDPSIITHKKRLSAAISYRFVRNINARSSKYGLWSIHASIEFEDQPVITDPSLGFIGVDLNYSHASVSETDEKGNLIQSFNIHFNPECYTQSEIKHHGTKTIRLIDSNNGTQTKLPSRLNNFKLAEPVKNNKNKKHFIKTDKMSHILGNACQIITDLSKRVGKPVVIEQLNFIAKKKELRYRELKLGKKDADYNRMLNSFAYNKFHTTIHSQARKKGLQVIEVNPMFSSIIGQMNYTLDHGISVHMAASYVIALRGEELAYVVPEKSLNNGKSKKKKYVQLNLKEVPKLDSEGQLNYNHLGQRCQLKPIANKEVLTATWMDIAKEFRKKSKDDFLESRRTKALSERDPERLQILDVFEKNDTE